MEQYRNIYEPLLKTKREKAWGASIMAAFTILAFLIIVEVMLVCKKESESTPTSKSITNGK